MHREPEQFVASVKKQYPEFFTGKRVLEVGSLDINGSARPFFTDCNYTGIDLGEGAGVDVGVHVVDYHRLSDGEYDVVISTETLEHDHVWNKSLVAMYRLLKPNGLLLITCAAPNRPEHGTTRTGSAEASPFTSDYYRNISIEDFASVLPANLFSKSYLGYRGNMDDLYFAGIKATQSPVGLVELVNRNGPIRFPAITESFLVPPSRLTVTAEISTKDRYHFLPLTISAILNQTHKPEKLVIYDDGEQKDLRTLSPFDGLLRLADHLGIKWEFFSTPREGQVRNHQHCLDTATTDLIWRIDDDEVPEPNCLESLLAEMKDGVGAVAGLVHHPTGVSPLPDSVKGGFEDIANGTNIQWHQFNSGPREVQHLYSTFIFSVEAAKKAGGYPKGLSAAGHREESWFTIAIHQAGYKLLVTPNAKTWHFHESTGGIRSFSDTSLWEHDDRLFQEYLKGIHALGDSKLIVADMGIGDHLLLKGIWNDIRRKNPDKKFTLALCYPEVFEGVEGVAIISIAEAKAIVGDRYAQYSLYQWCWDNNKASQPLPKSMLEFWG